MLTVLLVDDHVAMREGLEVLLERRAFSVMAAVGSAAAGIAAVKAQVPDVAVIDVRLPDGSGLDLVGAIRREPGDTKILIYTGSQDVDTLSDALSSGADGVLLKPGGVNALVDAMRMVARGDRYIDPEIAKIVAEAANAGHLLSNREREVFVLLASGQSGEEIASRLFLSPETVRTHVRNAMAKLEAKTRTEAVVKAMEGGEIGAGRS